MTKLLIVDDDQGILKQLRWALEREYELFLTSRKQEALEYIQAQKPELIALDVNLDGLNPTEKGGIEVLDEIHKSNPFSKVIMITGNDSKEVALEAVGKGVFDYYLKPINIEELKVILKRAVAMQDLERENRRLAHELENKFTFEHIVGTSPQMEDVFKLIRRVAPTDATVLLTGESGTGKELAARAIHYLSNRKDSPFMVINCGAIPENLLESELFGHEKGSFTDAHAKHIGKLEAADKGTVFLDEIGEMSLGLQVKILRFLQERVIEHVGGNTPIELDVRIIAATNSDLTQKIKDNMFRQDLYYRLSVINIELPPLRARGDDVLLLAQYFLNKYRKEVTGKDIKGFTKEAKDMMKNYSWPGNVREMDNKVRRAAILAEDAHIGVAELGFSKEKAVEREVATSSLKEARQELEMKLINRALEESKGNMSLTAKALGITRPTLYDLMHKYNMDPSNGTQRAKISDT